MGLGISIVVRRLILIFIFLLGRIMGEIILLIVVVHVIKSACTAASHLLEDWEDNHEKEKERNENLLKKHRR
jgi:hypothetical protein